MNQPATDPSTSARPRSAIKQIPIILLTGFLGSGKTTLLRTLLAAPTWSDTAVLVNELGAVGLDHRLMWGASGTMLVLENGCICCSIGDDLLGTLEDLFWRRLHRQVPHFNRVVIETTGLADPGPIIRALHAQKLVAERYRLSRIVCTVDAVFGAQQLAQHPESLAQAAAADLIVLTKTDIAPESVEAMAAQLHALNPLAVLTRGAAGHLDPAILQALEKAPDRHTGGLDHVGQVGQAAPVHVQTGSKAQSNAASGALVFHHRVIATVLRFDHPWQRPTFQHALETVIARFGNRILRIKGLIQVDDEPVPVVVQVVQTMIFPFETLAASNGDDVGTANAIVCITLGVLERDLRAVFGSAVP